MSFKQRSLRQSSGGKVGGTVRERVEKTEQTVEAAELKIAQQGTMIDDLITKNAELVQAITIYKAKLTEMISVEAERVSKDMKIKHSVLKAKNKQLSDLVIEQKAEKQMLIEQIVQLDERLGSIEDRWVFYSRDDSSSVIVAFATLWSHFFLHLFFLLPT